LLKLIFNKTLRHLSFIEHSENERLMQLNFLKKMLSIVKERLAIFQKSLIKEGKKEALLHGLLGFFKHLFFDFKIESKDLDSDEFLQWRDFFHDLLQTCLEINKVCSVLLSNNGLVSEGEEEGTGIQVDCRGHPIKMEGEIDPNNGDYENLILVGVWLAVKENGLTLYNLLKWAGIPSNESDESKFLVHKDISELCDRFLGMLFSFKHRGAIEKAAECFSLFC